MYIIQLLQKESNGSRYINQLVGCAYVNKDTAEKEIDKRIASKTCLTKHKFISDTQWQTLPNNTLFFSIREIEVNHV